MKSKSTADRRRTEQRLPESRNLDRMTSAQIVKLMNREDAKVPAAVRRELKQIGKAADAIVKSIQTGGRLIYVGAGTSGRLAILDAAECPPTFGIKPSEVVALIAGGKKAVTGAVEGAEDSAANGARDLRKLKLSKGDAVVGIAASGTTPYVLSAIKFANQKNSITIAITANRTMPLAKLAKIVIAPEIGPEVLTGSTRLKAGTSQKMVLNMLSTTAMVRLGHSYENLMIDLLPTNQKLLNRAERILSEASGQDLSTAAHALRQAQHNMRTALVMLKKKVSAKQAKQKLKTAKNNLRKALNEN
jgi:N-acetylmuramic acid 6-phosphate etherase